VKLLLLTVDGCLVGPATHGGSLRQTDKEPEPLPRRLRHLTGSWLGVSRLGS